MAYVYMRYLERVPQRYDCGMQLLTVRRLELIHQDVAERVAPGDRVLDIGCGTGALAIRLARLGAKVTGIDISSYMLAVARQRIGDVGLEDQVRLLCVGAVELDAAFADASFDVAVAVLSLSEMGEDEAVYAVQQCWRILGSGGRLLVADEVLPRNAFWRTVTALLRLPWSVATQILAGTTTRPIRGLPALIEQVGFELSAKQRYLLGSLLLVEAHKVEDHG